VADVLPLLETRQQQRQQRQRQQQQQQQQQKQQQQQQQQHGTHHARAHEARRFLYYEQRCNGTHGPPKKMGFKSVDLNGI
jgi:hypothetical protein